MWGMRGRVKKFPKKFFLNFVNISLTLEHIPHIPHTFFRYFFDVLLPWNGLKNKNKLKNIYLPYYGLTDFLLDINRYSLIRPVPEEFVEL